MSNEKGKVTFRDLIEFAILPLLSAAVFILWDMNGNINKLNIQVGVILAEREATNETLKDHELRLRILETNKPKGTK